MARRGGTVLGQEKRSERTGSGCAENGRTASRCAVLAARRRGQRGSGARPVSPAAGATASSPRVCIGGGQHPAKFSSPDAPRNFAPPPWLPRPPPRPGARWNVPGGSHRLQVLLETPWWGPSGEDGTAGVRASLPPFPTGLGEGEGDRGDCFCGGALGEGWGCLFPCV